MKRNIFRVLGALGALGALIAVLIMASGGPSNAAALITGAGIKDQTVESRDIAAEGVGTSEIRNQTIQSGDIAEAGVGSSEVRNGSLTGADMNPNTVKRFLAGERAQAENASQDAKISSLEDRVEAEETEGDSVGLNTARAGAGYTTFAAPGVSVLFNKCDVDGQVAISGGYRLNGHAAEAFQGGGAPVDGLTVIATEPVGVVNGELVNTYQHPDFPQTEDGGFQANAWAVTFNNTTSEPMPVRIYATCVSAN